MAVSTPLTPLGTALPGTRLPDLSGHEVDLAQYAAGRALLVFFSANHCPFVQHIESALTGLLAEYSPDRLAVAAIGSNDIENYPEDDVPHLQAQADRAGWGFPYLVDSAQTAARAFGALCTPDFFLFTTDAELAYRGGLDDSSPRNDRPQTGNDLRAAIDAVLAGRPVPLPHRPALGCSIKWKDASA